MRQGFMRGRRMLGSAMAAAAMVLVVASTAYACVIQKGDATVTGTVRTSNLMTGDGVSNGPPAYCAGRGPVTSAAGPASSAISASFAAATACNSGGTNFLSNGTYDVRLRNTTAGYTGADGTGWTQTAGSGCFAPANVGGANNFLLGTMSITSGNGTASFSGTVPSGATTTNSATDASIFCVGKQGTGGAAPTINSDGFLAPFRVSTV